MASSMSLAFAQADGPALDIAVGLVLIPRKPAPVDGTVREALRDFDWGQVDAISRRLARRYRCHYADAEDAVYDTVAHLLDRRRELFREPQELLAPLSCLARYRLIDRRRSSGSVKSVEALYELAEDAPFVGAQRCLPPSLDVQQEQRVPLPGPGESWTETQIISAFQQFRDYHGRPPRVTECLSRHQLPSPSTIYRRFGSFADAVLAAGMVPDTLGKRRQKWTPVEAATACLAFKERNGYWPGAGDCKRLGSGLPSSSVMIRCFGSTQPAFVQIGSEMILAGVDSKQPPR
jgi:Homing endonuclease associated repeat